MINFNEAKKLIEEALEELPADECPKCNFRNLVSGIVGEKEIEQFLRSKGIELFDKLEIGI